ncbi:hypothetical protein [uncultured Ruminococcus sp.]|uniref:hypothetical protein n=1 Tax=uncultured Ruminococcus sp. TaxID=165186 RepID=UPI00266B9FCB|nr:hypothetical protein [uncultured Ruminococcus sp.]
MRKLFVCSSAVMSKPSGGIRSLHSLSAWGLPTPVVALACIGNVDIQVLSGAGGQLYLIRRLQVYLFIIFHVQPISQGVTLLFFFAEKKKRSKKRKEFAFHLYCKIPISPEDYTRNCHHRFSSTKLPRRGIQAAAAAVTLLFLQLKLGRKVSGDSPQSPGGAYRRPAARRNITLFTVEIGA